MRYALQYSFAAGLVASAAAHQHHGHQRFHARRDGSPVEKRDADVTRWVPGAVETVFEIDGEIIPAEEIKEGLANGEYIVVGESEPTISAPPAPKPKPTTTKTSSSSADLGAKFIEKSSTTSSTTSTSTSSSTSTSTTSTSSPLPPTTTSAAPVQTSAAADDDDDTTTGGTGLTKVFKSGKVPCDGFEVAKYGAVALDWLDFDGWSGLQEVPDYSVGDLSISKIVTGIANSKCAPGTMCSYACPAGYQKTQWSDAQGADNESIGGLYCNSDGMLELTRSDYDVLCDPGVGGVTIQNDLKKSVATCRTDYPGTESMVIPAVAEPGSSVAICNPDQDTYYVWDGKKTTAQYYVNNAGVSVEDACVWNSATDPDAAGNWAPVILGVGRASDGITFISIFQNSPTSTAKLNFNIEITGDVNSECSYIDGKWTGGSNGCTTGMTKGGEAVIRYF